MITNTFYRDDNKNIIAFEITGHADSGPYGYDIVCAAVSVLSIGTINNLQRLAQIKPKVDADELNGGYLKMTLPEIEDEESRKTSQILLDNLYYSLKDVAAEYDVFVKIVDK